MNPRKLGMNALVLILFPLFSEALAQSNAVTLKDAVRSAIEKTESVPIGQARVNQSDARVDQAFSRFFPTLSLGASYQRQDTTGVLSRQSSALFGGGQSYARFTLFQSVYEGGRDLANWRANLSDRTFQEQMLSVTSYALFTNVARAFYAVLSSEREVENLKLTIRLANERVKDLAERKKIGRSRNVELLAAQAQVSVLQAQLMAAEGQVVTAWDQFVLITGLSRDVQLVQKKEMPDPPEGVEVYLGLIENRPDIASIKAQMDGIQSSADVARAGHLPAVGLTGNYYPYREGTQKGNHWDIGVALTLPLFAGGAVSAQVREASAKNRESELNLSQARRQAEISVRTAYNNLAASLRQIDALRSALSSTEENYKEQAKNYRFGQATNLDVIQALNSLQDTRRTLDRTRFLALSAWAELKAATAQVSLANIKGDP